MNCPKCNKKTEVLDSRSNKGGTQTRRRRSCNKCKISFTTFERRNDATVEQKSKLLEDTMQGIIKEIETLRLKLTRVNNSKQTLPPLTKHYS